MAAKVCPHPTCPRLIPPGATGCQAHARPNAHQRGYDAAHRRQSKAWKQRIRSGQVVTCWRCGERITDADDCDLGHDDEDRSTVRGPEHARGCNRSSAGRKSRRDEG